MAIGQQGLHSYVHPLGAKINIYYVNNVLETVNPESLNAFINDIHNNFKKYHKNIFSKVNIEIWDERRYDIPTNKYTCEGGTCKQTDYGIANYAGLTWAWRDMIHINGRNCSNDFDLAQILSHEVGHYIDYLTELSQDFNPNDVIYPEWLRIRANTNPTDIIPVELMAEDIRCLLGCRLAQGHDRGTQTSPKTVKGLKDMLLIWHPVFNFIQDRRKQGHNIYNSYVSYKYSETDFNYFGVQLRVDVPINNTTARQEWYWIDRVAVYAWVYKNNKWQWQVEKSF